METMRLTKTKTDNVLIGGISRMINTCSYIILKGDCMHSIIEVDDIGATLKKNGTTIVKSFIGLTLSDGIIMRSVYGLADTISTIRKRVKASKEIYMVYDNTKIGLLLDNEYVGLFVEDDPLKYVSKTDNYESYISYVMDTYTTLSIQQSMDIAMSKVVEVSIDDCRVRLSKNCIPLLGPVRKDTEPKFSVRYNIRRTSNMDGILCLNVDYGNGTNALHLYSIILY